MCFARRLASRRAGPCASLAGSLRAGQAHVLRSQARFAQGTATKDLSSFSWPASELRILRKLRMTAVW